MANLQNGQNVGAKVRRRDTRPKVGYQCWKDDREDEIEGLKKKWKNQTEINTFRKTVDSPVTSNDVQIRRDFACTHIVMNRPDQSFGAPRS